MNQKHLLTIYTGIVCFLRVTFTNHVQNGNAACPKTHTHTKKTKKHTNKPVTQLPNLASSELQSSVNQRSAALLRHPH